MVSPPRQREILVLGDLHGHYDDQDARFIEARGAELCVFVGDLGDEDPDIAREITRLDVPYRVLLGNHDAWESFRHKEITPALAETLDVLGDRHFAYDLLDLHDLGVTVLGCRPFSWGGPSLRSPEVYEELYGVRSHEDSAARIVEVAGDAEYDDLVLVAHNGPRGLGARPSDIYGKDFGKPGGDWGDIDLRKAIRALADDGYRVRLVVAGHMHHRLAYPRGELRRRCVIKPDTIYVNPARVPRIFRDKAGETVRHYLSVRIEDGEVQGLAELYVTQSECREVPLFAQETTT